MIKDKHWFEAGIICGEVGHGKGCLGAFSSASGFTGDLLRGGGADGEDVESMKGKRRAESKFPALLLA